MSIFGNILRKIFPSSHPAVASAPSSAAPGAPSPASGAAPGATAAGSAAPAATAAGSAAPGAAPAAAGSAPSAQAAGTMPAVDVEQVLNAMAQKRGEKLNWRTSIVDLMKLLDLDSSLGARKQLAGELGYSGDTSDSATMNIWLHKQVMQRLAANGGKVPDELK